MRSLLRRGTIAATLALVAGPVAPLLAQPAALRLVLDSIVAPDALHGSIRQLIALDSVTAVVLDGQANEISVISARERDARAISRRGDGPGEFRFATAIGRFRDSVWVFADYGKKFALLSLNGRGGTTNTVRVVGLQSHPGGNWSPRMMLPDGSSLVTLAYDPQQRYDDGARRVPVWIMPRDSDARREVTTLETFGTRYVRFADEPGSTSFRSNPFAGGDLLLPRNDGTGFVIVRQTPVQPDAAAPLTIETYDATGRRVRVATITLPPLLDGARRAESAMRALDEAVGGGAGASDIRRQLGPVTGAPGATKALLASDGTIWIRRFGWQADSTSWTRVDPATGGVAAVTIPAQCAPLDAAQERLWVGCTEQDVPVVRRAWVRN